MEGRCCFWLIESMAGQSCQNSVDFVSVPPARARRVYVRINSHLEAAGRKAFSLFSHLLTSQYIGLQAACAGHFVLLR